MLYVVPFVRVRGIENEPDTETPAGLPSGFRVGTAAVETKKESIRVPLPSSDRTSRLPSPLDLAMRTAAPVSEPWT